MKWYAKYREPETGEWLSLVTPYRMTDPGGKRKALVWAAELDRVGEATKGTAKNESWHLWAPDWIQLTYSYNPLTLRRYNTIWCSLYDFLSSRRIGCPRLVEYGRVTQTGPPNQLVCLPSFQRFPYFFAPFYLSAGWSLFCAPAWLAKAT